MSAGLYEITVNALLDRGTALSRTEWGTAAARVGHERVPALLVELTDADLLAADVLTRAVADAWSAPKDPTHRLDPEQWVELFTDAGYTVDGEPAPRPVAATRLYRSDDEQVGGLVWTDDGDRALWTTLAPPQAFLARITGADGHVEHLVDPSRLGAVTAV